MYAMNELQALVYKAAVGCGVPVGNAQELAAAGVWLARRRFPACEIIVRGLAGADDSHCNARKTDRGIELAAARAIMSGPGAIDHLIAAGDTDHHVRLTGLDEPSLLAAMVGVAADRFALAFALATPDDTIVIGPTSDIASATIPLCGPIDVTLRYASPGETANRSADLDTRYDPAAVSDTGWTQLENLAQRTYVPATDQSRARGAGAGLTDND